MSRLQIYTNKSLAVAFKLHLMQIFVVCSPDNFLTRTLSSEEGGVSRLVLRLMSAAENLPSHSAEMMRNALPDQLLQLQTLWLGTLRVIGPWLVHPPSHLDVAGLPLVPVLEDVTPCEPEVALPSSTGFSALLAAACTSVKCLSVGKCHWSCLVTWLHRNLRGDARSSWVARSRLRFSSRHTETAERLGVALNQSDIRHTSYHQSFQTDNLQHTTCLLPRASWAARARPWWAPLCRTPGCSWSQPMSRRLSWIF